MLADVEKGDTLAAAPFVNSLILKFKKVLSKSKQGIATTQIKDLVEDLKLKLSGNSKIPLTEEAKEYLDGEKDSEPKVMSLYLSDIFGGNKENHKHNGLLSIFRKTFIKKDKNHQILIPETYEILSQTFKDIKKQSWFQQYTEDEFQLLIYQGDDPNMIEKFQKFLIGIINYLDPDQQAETEIIKFGLQFLNGYLEPNSQKSSPAELQKRQNYLFTCRLDKLLCNLISTTDDPEIMFLCFEAANGLIHNASAEKQNAFIDTINSVDSYQFLNGPLTIIRDYLHKLEKEMQGVNSENLLKQMFSLKGDTAPNNKREVGIYIESAVAFYHFLSSLCRGHNPKAQQFLTSQAPPNRTVNILLESCDHLKTGSRLANKQALPLLVALLGLLADSAWGPAADNQRLLLEYKILDLVRDVLAEIDSQDALGMAVKGFTADDPAANELLKKCYFYCLYLLASLVESKDDKVLLEEIGRIVEFDELMLHLEYYFDDYCLEFNKSNHSISEGTDASSFVNEFRLPIYNTKMQSAFTMFYLMKTIKAETNIYSTDIREITGKRKFIFNFFDFNTVSIEVNFNSHIQKIFFVKYPACYYFSQLSKNKFINTVKRESPNQKVGDFVQSSPMMFNEMDYTFELKKRFRVDPNYSQYLREIALVVCYILNFYLLVTSKFKVIDTEQQEDKSSYSEAFFRSMAVAYLVLISLAIVLYYLDSTNINRINQWVRFFKQLKNMSNITSEEKTWIESYLNRDIFTLGRQDYNELIKFKRAKEGNRHSAPWFTKFAYDLTYLDGQLFLLTFYFVCFFGGLVTSDYWMLSIPLLDIIVEFNNLENVRSVADRSCSDDHERQPDRTDGTPLDGGDLHLLRLCVLLRSRHFLERWLRRWRKSVHFGQTLFLHGVLSRKLNLKRVPGPLEVSVT